MDWTKETTTLATLEAMAKDTPACFSGSIFGWMKRVGLVPEDVASMKKVQVRIDIDPDALPKGYLAACAYEWDTWGDSHPMDFAKAIRLETKGNTGRDLIAETLTALGRAVIQTEL